MKSLVIRFTGPAVVFLFWLGLELSSYENLPLAIAIWGIAVVWGILALITYSPINKGIRNFRKIKNLRIVVPDKDAMIRRKALETTYQDQKAHIEQFIKIEVLSQDSFIDGRHLKEQNPYLFFNYVVTNLSMFDIEVGDASGRIQYTVDIVAEERPTTSKYKDAPVLTEKPTWNNLAFRRPLKLQQWVLPEVAAVFLTPLGKKDNYHFDFKELTIPAKATIGDVVHELRLPLPAQTSCGYIRGVTP